MQWQYCAVCNWCVHYVPYNGIAKRYNEVLKWFLWQIVFIILVYASYDSNGQAYKWTWNLFVQPLFCLSSVVGLIGLCVENYIVMKTVSIMQVK